MKKTYITPSLTVIGRLAALTGEYKDGHKLDNTAGANAWFFPPAI